MKKSNFEDLQCWQAGRELRRFVYASIVKILPKEERYLLGSQILRAARSVTANIAEGYGRYHYLDEAKFLSIARGSAHETLDHLITGNDDGFLSDGLVQSGRELVDEAIRLINGYRAYVLRKGKEKDGNGE